MVKFRLYFDKDKEEAWLNEMSQRGYAMEHFFLGFYRFKPCQPGDYIYQIDLMSEAKKHMSYTEYVELITESGAQYVDRWFYWSYFRRKAELGEFELYTDTSSKLEQYKRISRFFKGAVVLEWAIFLYNLAVYVNLFLRKGSDITWVPLTCSAIMLLVALAISCAYYKTRKKIKELQRELI